MAGETGLEPATFGVTSRCSSQLRYSPATEAHTIPDRRRGASRKYRLAAVASCPVSDQPGAVGC